MERICPTCGASSLKEKFAGEHCLECALGKDRLKWPSQIEIAYCQKCTRIWHKSVWKPSSPSLLAAIIERAFTKAKLDGHYNVEAGRWEGVVEREGQRVDVEQPVEIKWRKEVCPDCNRASSGYFEAIIQLRGKKEKVEKFAKRLEKRLRQITFLPKFEEMHGGLDIYIGVKKDVPSLLDEEGLKFVRTEKLSGEKNGKRLYRSTFLIRFADEEEKKDK